MDVISTIAYYVICFCTLSIFVLLAFLGVLLLCVK